MSEPTHDPTLRRLPVVVLLVESRCDGRCVMCGYWSHPRSERLDVADVARLVPQLAELGTELVALSGGEPLAHPACDDVMATVAAGGFHQVLVTNGLQLEEHAERVAAACAEVVVSLDGPEEVHDDIRGVPGAFRRLQAGVGALRRRRPGLPIVARCTVQRRNIAVLGRTVRAARRMGLDGLSLLPVDAGHTSFERTRPPLGVGIPYDEIDENSEMFARFLFDCTDEIASGFIRESADVLRRRILGPLVRAARGEAGESPRCNAPWVSAVIEPGGAVRPCFFQPPIGSIHDGPLAHVIDGPRARQLRRELRIADDPTCRRCVCPLFRVPPG